jgi:glycolate oxidase FAD binding subunit
MATEPVRADATAAVVRLRDRVHHAQATRSALCFKGSGSKDFYGQVPRGEPCSLAELTGVLSYEPTELVITAYAGSPLAMIEACVAEHHQMLAFEPPHFGPAATLGGTVASGLSGPRRMASGAIKDFVLGASLMNSQGEILHFGGQVMKNVAGYDVSRLLCGSLGILGPIIQVSLKVLPKPMAVSHWQAACTQAEALAAFNRWATQPLPVSATCWIEGQAWVRLEGSAAALEAAIKPLREDLPLQQCDSEQASRFWADLREQSLPQFRHEQLWRFSLPPTAPVLALDEPCVVEWSGGIRWVGLPSPESAQAAQAQASRLRAIAESLGGTASLWRGRDRSIEVFHPMAPALLRIHQRLKAEFDPQGVFNPGRMSPHF